MHAGIAVHTQAEAVLGVFIKNAVPELDDVLLKAFVACWVIESLPHDSGVARPEHVGFGDPDEVTNLKT